MSDFDALLKRSFAEAHEPADNGFSLRVNQAVARREMSAQVRNRVQAVGLVMAGAALAYGAYALIAALGIDFVAIAGDQIGEVRGAISAQAPEAAGFADSAMQSLGAGMTQILLAAAALVGGAVAYRSAQE
jgi:hypothetical protein